MFIIIIRNIIKINSIKENQLNNIITAEEKLPIPDSVSYLPAINGIKLCSAAKYAEKEFLGTLPTQVGYC